MDKDLMKLAVEMASAHIKTNAIISTQDPRFDASYVETSTMEDIVMEYYNWLKNKD